jgi:DNA-binding CsgD family transcriptional regulator
MGIEQGRATQTDDVEVGQQIDRLFEAAEWLRTRTPMPEEASSHPMRAMRALVVDFGPTARLLRGSLRGFSDRFPGIAVLVHEGAAPSAHASLAVVIDTFSCSRRLSPRQRAILELHLDGKNDKEIAASLGCELATVYEHWRRMGRKSEGSGKGDLVADFHRYLTRDFQMTSDNG